MTETTKIFVVPGEGRKVPLPVPGGRSVPAGGTYVIKTLAVTRLLRTGDLVLAKAPVDAPKVTRTTAKAAVKTAAPEGTELNVESGVLVTSGGTTAAASPAQPASAVSSGGSAVVKGEK